MTKSIIFTIVFNFITVGVTPFMFTAGKAWPLAAILLWLLNGMIVVYVIVRSVQYKKWENIS